MNGTRPGHHGSGSAAQAWACAEIRGRAAEDLFRSLLRVNIGLESDGSWLGCISEYTADIPQVHYCYGGPRAPDR